VFRELVALCKRLDLLDTNLVAIDGSKFKALNSQKRHFTPKSLRESLVTLDEKIARYLRELDENDGKEAQEEHLPARVPDLKRKIAEMRERKKQQTALLSTMEVTGETEVSLTDPDCRSMKTHGIVDLCYNTQIAVEAKSKLIVEYDVSNHPSDDGELAQMAVRAREALGVERLNVTADKGYYSGEQVQRCVENGITPYIPEIGVRAGAAKRRGLSLAFTLDKFQYESSSDTVVCPTGQRLTPVGPGINVRWGMRSAIRRAQVYRTEACFGCPHYMGDCTKNPKGRHVMRTEFDDSMEAMRGRMKTAEGRSILRLRQELVEHPFGTIKRGFQQGHLLLKGLRKTTGEMGLTLMAYDLRRILNIAGTKRLIMAVGG
jgi:hypothetical protein